MSSAMNPHSRRRSAPAASHPGASEHQEAIAFMAVVKLHEAEHRDLRWLYAIPNGGHRGKASAGRMKAEGVRAGVSDYFLPAPRDGHHGLYIELKTQTGQPSREQRDFIADMRANGYRAEVARGWAEAWAIVCDYLSITSRISPCVKPLNGPRGCLSQGGSRHDPPSLRAKSWPKVPV